MKVSLFSRRRPTPTHINHGCSEVCCTPDLAAGTGTLQTPYYTIPGKQGGKTSDGRKTSTGPYLCPGLIYVRPAFRKLATDNSFLALCTGCHTHRVASLRVSASPPCGPVLQYRNLLNKNGSVKKFCSATTSL